MTMIVLMGGGAFLQLVSQSTSNSHVVEKSMVEFDSEN